MPIVPTSPYDVLGVLSIDEHSNGKGFSRGGAAMSMGMIFDNNSSGGGFATLLMDTGQ